MVVPVFIVVAEVVVAVGPVTVVVFVFAVVAAVAVAVGSVEVVVAASKVSVVGYLDVESPGLPVKKLLN